MADYFKLCVDHQKLRQYQEGNARSETSSPVPFINTNSPLVACSGPLINVTHLVGRLTAAAFLFIRASHGRTPIPTANRSMRRAPPPLHIDRFGVSSPPEASPLYTAIIRRSRCLNDTLSLTNLNFKSYNYLLCVLEGKVMILEQVDED